MTKSLSITTQNVLDAAYFTYHRTRDINLSIAGLLRELVKELKYIGITEKNILEIADEMEGK